MEEISLTFIISPVKGKVIRLFQLISTNKYLKLYYRWNNLNESIRSGMAVLDVTIPTGYWIQQQKLDAYVISKRVRNLQRAKFNDKKVLFYFDFVS